MAVAEAAVLSAGRVVETEVAVAVVDHPAKRAAVADVARRPEVVSAVKADTVRIAVGVDHRRRMAAEAVEIVPVAVPPQPNAAVVVPSSWRQPTAPEKSARA